MKPENFDKVKELMDERTNAINQANCVAKSNCITFSIDGYGRTEFVINEDSLDTIKKFKDDILIEYNTKIKAIDDKLAEL